MPATLRLVAWLPAVALLVAACTTSTGCATTRAKAPAPPPPPLDVPAVPARVVPPPAPEPDEPEAEPEPATPPARRPARSSTTRPRVEPAPRPEGADPARPDAAARPTQEAEPSRLRVPDTADTAEAEKRISETLARVRRALSQVKPESLGREARTQFDTAQRFVDQAETALRAQNYLFATYLADKAEALARGITGR